MKKRKSIKLFCLDFFLLLFALFGLETNISQKAFDRVLGELVCEVETPPNYVTWRNDLHLDGRIWNIRELENIFEISESTTVLLVDQDYVYLGTESNTAGENTETLSLYRMSRDGSRCEKIYSGLFSGAAMHHLDREWPGILNDLESKIFYDRGSVILTDREKLVEYHVAENRISEGKFVDYAFPPMPKNVQLNKGNSIQVIQNGQTRVITPETLAKSSTAFASMLELYDPNSGKELFQQLRYDGNHWYLVCYLPNEGGHVNAVVYEIDLESETVKFCFWDYEGLQMSYSIYTVPTLV